MKSSKGFILVESLLALGLVMLLAMTALQLIVGAANIAARGQSLLESSQLATQASQGEALSSTRYRIRRQYSEQQLANGLSIRRELISVYDIHKDTDILSLLVYE